MLQLVKIIRNPPVRTQTYFLCRLQAREILASERLLSVRLTPSFREYSTSIPSQYDHLKILEDIDHKPAQVFICQTCEKSFKSLKSLGQHHSNSEKCSGEYHVIPSSSDTIAMYDTLQIRSSKEVESVTSKKRRNIKHTCDFCSGSFDSTAKFTRHLRYCHPYKIAKNEAEMKGEEEKDVRFIRKSPPGIKLFKCEKCSMAYSRKGDLERHIAVGCGKKEALEPKSFEKNSSLKLKEFSTASTTAPSTMPVVEETNADPEEIELTRTFSQPAGKITLDGRIAMDPDNEKKYSCVDCGKSYKKRAHLVRVQSKCGRCIELSPEERIAMDPSHVKKYSCVDCGKRTVKKGNLVRIQSTCERCINGLKLEEKPAGNITLDGRIAMDPDNEKKYSCVDCGKSYKKRGNLVRVQSTCGRCLECAPPTDVSRVSADSLPNTFKSPSPLDVSSGSAEADESHPDTSHSTSAFDNISVPSINPATEENQQNFYKNNQDILRAFFDLKVNLGHLGDAHRQFKDILAQPQNAPNAKCVEIYNVLLRGFAREPFNVHTVQSLMEEMEDEGISPNLSSYISMIMSFHETDPHDDYYKLLLNNVLDKCEEEGFGIATALAKGDFLLSDKQIFVETLKRFGKSEQIQTGAIENKLTSALLTPLQYFGSKNLQSQVDTVFVPEDMRALLKKQISHEKSHRVTVPSIVQHKNADALRSFYNSLKKTWRRRIMESLDDLDIKSQQPIYSGIIIGNNVFKYKMSNYY